MTAADPLTHALDEAIAGRRRLLLDRLANGSHLPGPRPNVALADAFAQLCRARGEAADAVALAMARMTADEAPGATPLEFLPMCGVLALGARAAADASARARLLAELHEHADDLRFRVRDAVVDALGRIGAAGGDALVADVGAWMDGYFHAAAVVTALSRDPWLPHIHRAEGAVERLDEAFDLARRAPRAAARYPGRKALVEAVARAPSPLAVRFGVVVFDALVRWTASDDPELRALVAGVIEDRRLASRFAADVGRVARALTATRAPVRNPDHDVGPTRDRSKRRGRARS